MKRDTHVHTSLCRHAEGEMEEYVLEAIRLGVVLGFSDHTPNLDGFNPAKRMSWESFPLYVESVQSLAMRYPEAGIRLGVEADIYPGFEDSLCRLKEAHPIEFVIGSVHWVESVFIFAESPPLLSVSEKLRIIREYGRLLREGLKSGLIDIIGHMDAIRCVFGNEPETIEEACVDVLEETARQGKAIELNTSGWRRKTGSPFPNETVLAHAARIKIPVCLGSDAHCPQHLTYAFEQASGLLDRLAYTSETRENGLDFHYPAT